jgi:hypothetical protein
MQFVEPPPIDDLLAEQHAIADEFFAAVIKEAVDIGLDLLRLVRQQAIACAIDRPNLPLDDTVIQTYDRVFRAMRRGALLAKRLRKPDAPPRLQSAPCQPGDAPPDTERPATDRLDRPDRLDREPNDTRPASEIIADIYKDLGHPSPLTPGKAPGAGSPQYDHPGKTHAERRVQSALGLHHPNDQPDPRTQQPEWRVQSTSGLHHPNNRTDPRTQQPERRVQSALGLHHPNNQPNPRTLQDHPHRPAAMPDDPGETGPPYRTGS